LLIGEEEDDAEQDSPQLRRTAACTKPAANTSPAAEDELQEPALITAEQARWLTAEYQRLQMDLTKSLRFLGLETAEHLTVEGFENLKGLIDKREQGIKEGKVGLASSGHANGKASQ
jgi:hypothetical protein